MNHDSFSDNLFFPVRNEFNLQGTKGQKGGAFAEIPERTHKREPGVYLAFPTVHKITVNFYVTQVGGGRSENEHIMNS